VHDVHWFWAIIGAEGIIIALVCWYGIRHQTNRFGCYVQRAEAIIERGENVAIELRCCITYHKDLLREQHQDHPVIPPDAFPDADQERTVA
jgi:hypothetical protein